MFSASGHLMIREASEDTIIQIPNPRGQEGTSSMAIPKGQVVSMRYSFHVLVSHLNPGYCWHGWCSWVKIFAPTSIGLWFGEQIITLGTMKTPHHSSPLGGMVSIMIRKILPHSASVCISILQELCDTDLNLRPKSMYRTEICHHRGRLFSFYAPARLEGNALAEWRGEPRGMENKSFGCQTHPNSRCSWCSSDLYQAKVGNFQNLRRQRQYALVSNPVVFHFLRLAGCCNVIDNRINKVRTGKLGLFGWSIRHNITRGPKR